MSEVLLTGCNSFVGKNILPIIKGKTEHKITATYHNNVDTDANVFNEIDLIKIDLADRNDYEKLPNKIETIIHCASASSNSYSFLNLTESNITSIINIIDYAKLNGVKKIINLSSLSVYGTVQDDVVDEYTDSVNPSFYGSTKRIGELLLQEADGWLSSFSIRLPAVLGKGAMNHWPSMVLNHALKGEQIEIYNSESRFNNAVDVESLALFFIKLIDSELTGAHVMPVSAAGFVSIKQAVETIIYNVKSKSKVLVNDSEKKSFIVDHKKALKYGYQPKDISSILEYYSLTEC
jgi:nucleoside-diphosphate-sugar epimerase